MALPNFSFVTPNLAGCAHPRYPEAIDEIERQGCDAVVRLVEVPLSQEYIQELDRRKIQHFHIPVKDFTAPTIEQLTQFVEIVSNHKRTLVHCKGGMGRTGTFLAAYLISANHNVDATIQFIRALRPHSIETRDQEKILKIFSQETLKD
jgi:atypical dual specificity phosphatase